MKRLSCKIGDKFGFWEVINNIPIVISGHTYVTVKCKCGSEEIKCLSDMVHGRTKGCRNCMARERSPKIEIGKKYKHWTVIGEGISNKDQNLVYKVQCDCGCIQYLPGRHILDNNRSFMCRKCWENERKKTIKTVTINDKKLLMEKWSGKYHKIEHNAKIRNINFDVSMEYLWNLYISQEKKCAITGDFIPSIRKASLDRIDSNLGYIEGNVQWVTRQANLSKHIMTMNELYIFCEKVLNHANQQPSQPLTKLEGSETNS